MCNMFAAQACLAVDEERKNAFVDKFKDKINTMATRDVPTPLFRGVKLHPPNSAEKPSRMVFFTDDVHEAVAYAKHKPRAVYIFDVLEPMKVIDLTDITTIKVLEEIALTCNIPPAVITKFAALDEAANTAFEHDVSYLLHDIMCDNSLAGFFRRTMSSTLDRPATEYDIFRVLIPKDFP